MGVVVVPALRGRFTKVVLHEHRVDVVDVGRVAVVLGLDVRISNVRRGALGVDRDGVVVLQRVYTRLGPHRGHSDSRTRGTCTSLLRGAVGHVTIGARLTFVGGRRVELPRDMCIYRSDKLAARAALAGVFDDVARGVPLDQPLLRGARRLARGAGRAVREGRGERRVAGIAPQRRERAVRAVLRRRRRALGGGLFEADGAAAAESVAVAVDVARVSD